MRQSVLKTVRLFLAEHDPARPVVKGEYDREVVKAAVGRKLDLLEEQAVKAIRDYFELERQSVVRAAGRRKSVNRELAEASLSLKRTLAAVKSASAGSWGAWLSDSYVRKAEADDEKRVDAWLAENLGVRVVGISERTRKLVAKEIATGVNAGDSMQQIANRIDKFYLDQIIPDRSMVIARTEVTHAVNWLQNLYALDADVPMEKEWLSLHDHRTRETHADADGQRVPLDEPFDVGDSLLMYPGDDSLGAPGSEVINCRCTTVHHVTGVQLSKSFDPAEQRDERGRWAAEAAAVGAARETVEAAGASWVGVQRAPGSKKYPKGLALFNDPRTDTTLAVPMHTLTAEAVRRKLWESRKAFETATPTRRVAV